MLFLKTAAVLTADKVDELRKQIKDLTGEDCVILSGGFTVEWIPVKKDGEVPGKETSPRVRAGTNHCQELG